MEYECPICLTDLYYLCLTKCKHHICISCLVNLHNPICPICRSDLQNELPKNILDIIKNNNSKIKKNNNNGIDLLDLYDFPPL